MNSAEFLRSEVSQYLILADQLKERYGEIDDETLRDTLEGISNLPQVIEAVVRSSLEDGAYVSALKQRMDDMQARLSRLKDRYSRKRELACWAMSQSGIERLQAADFSLTLRAGMPRLEVIDETRIPPAFFVPQPPKLDRTLLTTALKSGEMVNGALLVQGEPGITVRVL
jgi:hypothetical protein